ncbi:MAG: hypothetical protein AB7H93_08520 [Vicinamibacterales bacterium]
MPESRRPTPSTFAIAALAMAGAAATLAAVAVPEAPLGFAVRWRWPTATDLVVAVAVAWSARLPGRRAIVAPLAVLGAFAAAPDVAAAWTFHGWGAVIVWAIVVAAVCRGATLPPTAAWSGQPRRHAAVAALAATAWLGGLAVAVSPHALTGDAPHYLTIARSLVADGDLDLANDYDDRTYADFYPGSLEPRHTNTSPWGEQYSFHGIGVAVLVAPAFAMWGVPGATATLVVVMAAGGALLWLAVWHLLRDAAAAWAGWAALTASAPFALHAAAVYPDGPAAAGVAAGLWLLALLQRGGTVPLWALAAGSSGLAVLPWLHARLAWPAAVFGLAIVVAIWRRQPERWTRLAWFLMVPVISLAGWVAAAQVMFGTWNPSAAILQRTAPGTWNDMARGLVGLIADQEYGLVPSAPVMAIAIAALPRFLRACPAVGAATALAAAGVLAMSSLWMWWGGDSAPARFLVVTLPALALWMAHGWSSATAGGRRVMVLGLAVSAAMTVLYASIDGGARAYAFADGRASVFAAFSHSVDVGLALPALFRPGETLAASLRLALVWLAAGAVAAFLVARMPLRGDDASATGMGGLVILVAAAVAAGTGWRLTGRTPWTTDGAALALVQGVADGRGGVGVGLDSWRPRPVGALIGGLRLRTPESVPLQPPMWLYLPNVPAGRYAVGVAASSGAAPTLRLELGRDAWPFTEWTGSPPPPSITLHTAVHSVRVIGEAPAGTAVWLEPHGVGPGASREQARRVTRYGDTAVYSMDDDSYVDPGGIWTGGNRTTRLLVAPPDHRPIEVTVEAGPVPVEVTLPAHAALGALAANERRVVPLGQAGPAGVIDLRVAVRGGFPAAALGAPSDSRTFGVRLSFSPRSR